MTLTGVWGAFVFSSDAQLDWAFLLIVRSAKGDVLAPYQPVVQLRSVSGYAFRHTVRAVL